MKREIKFRVWHKTEKRYLPLTEGTGSDYRVLTIDAATGNVSMFNAYGLEKPINYAKEDCVIEQYTGLKDKNWKEIYEGDVCRRRNYSSTNLSDNKLQIGFIEYSVNRACFIFVSGRRYSNLDATMGNDEGTFDERLTVIGTIHDKK